jgi:ABC-type nitrate/sulfonate/bicarbonate transport system substrate-binding protein
MDRTNIRTGSPTGWWALAVALLLVVAACGDGGEGDATTTAADEGEATTTSAEVVADTTEAAEETTTTAAPELREVDVALSTTSAFGYGYWIALDLGFYEEEGLDVNLQGTGGSADVAQLLATQNAVAGMGVPGAMLPAIQAGASLYPFFTYAYGEVFDVVVREGSDLTSIADLESQVLGISELAGGEVPLVRALLIEAGLDPDSDVQIIEVGTDAPSVLAAFESGRIHAYSSAKSDIAAMSATGLNTVSIAPESLSTLPAEGLLATDETRDDVDLLVGLGRATAKGQLVAYTSIDAAVCVLKNQIPEEFTDEEAGRASLEAVVEITTAPQENGEYVFGFLDAEGWNTYVNIFIQGGVLSEEIDMGEYVISDHVPAFNEFDQQAIVDLANGLPTDC